MATVNEKGKGYLNNESTIDFVAGERSDIVLLKNDDYAKQDLLFATDHGTIFTQGVEFGGYNSQETLGETTATVGGIRAGTSLNELKKMSLVQVIDQMLFPGVSGKIGSVEYKIEGSDQTKEVGEPYEPLELKETKTNSGKYTTNGRTFDYLVSEPKFNPTASPDSHIAVWDDSPIVVTSDEISYSVQLDSKTDKDDYVYENGVYYAKDSKGNQTDNKINIVQNKTLDEKKIKIYGAYKILVHTNEDYYDTCYVRNENDKLKFASKIDSNSWKDSIDLKLLWSSDKNENIELPKCIDIYYPEAISPTFDWKNELITTYNAGQYDPVTNDPYNEITKCSHTSNQDAPSFELGTKGIDYKKATWNFKSRSVFTTAPYRISINMSADNA